MSSNDSVLCLARMLMTSGIYGWVVIWHYWVGFEQYHQRYKITGVALFLPDLGKVVRIWTTKMMCVLFLNSIMKIELQRSNWVSFLGSSQQLTHRGHVADWWFFFKCFIVTNILIDIKMGSPYNNLSFLLFANNLFITFYLCVGIFLLVVMLCGRSEVRIPGVAV